MQRTFTIIQSNQHVCTNPLAGDAGDNNYAGIGHSSGMAQIILHTGFVKFLSLHTFQFSATLHNIFSSVFVFCGPVSEWET